LQLLINALLAHEVANRKEIIFYLIFLEVNHSKYLSNRVDAVCEHTTRNQHCNYVHHSLNVVNLSQKATLLFCLKSKKWKLTGAKSPYPTVIIVTVEK